jgi:hypothetical protein
VQVGRLKGPIDEGLDMRPPGWCDRLGVRLVLGTGALFGVVFVAYTLSTRPSAVGIDFVVYDVAARASLAGENFLAVTHPHAPAFTYVYPPLSVVLFYPYALLPSWEVGFLVHTVVTVAVGVLTAAILVHYLESHGYDLPPLDRALVVLFVVVSSHAAPSLVFGQVNHHLALALTAGFVLLERGREEAAGATFAAAAFVKVFPAAVGVWLLRRRAWRAIAAAVATGTGLVVASVLAFGVDLHRYYLTHALLPRLEHEAFRGGLEPAATYLTLRRPLSVLFPEGPTVVWAVGALVVLAPPVAVCYWDVDGLADRLVAIQATLIAILLFVPSFPIYAIVLSFPLVPLLYILEAGRPRRLFVAGALLANLSIRLDDLTVFLSAVPLPRTDLVLDVLTPVFTVGTPPLYGLLVLLGGCVLHAMGTSSGRRT